MHSRPTHVLCVGLALVAVLVAGNARSQDRNGIVERAEGARLLQEYRQQVQSLFQKGELARGTSLAESALALATRVYGHESPHTAAVLNELGLLHLEQGQYSRAEPLLKEALAIAEKTLGLQHQDTGTVMNSLAGLYARQGQLQKAKVLYERALEIREKALGPQHHYTASSLDNLAAVYESQGERNRAEKLHRRALAIKEKTLGRNHPSTLTTLNNLAITYLEKGELERARPMLERALEITAKNRGLDHLDTIGSQNNLADLYYLEGQYRRAEPLYKKAAMASERNLGPEHPVTTGLWLNLGLVYGVLGNDTLALECFNKAARARERYVARELPAKDESARYAFLSSIRGELDGIIGWSLRQSNEVVACDARRLALQVLLQRRGVVLDLGRESLGLLRREGTPADVSLVKSLQEARGLLSSLVEGDRRCGGTSGREPDGCAPLRHEVERLEIAIARRFSELRHESKPVTVDAVQSLIGRGQALVELATYRPFLPTARAWKERWGRPRYVAFVLGAEGEPKAVDLGERALFDELASRYVTAIEQRSDEAQRIGTAMYRKVMAPLGRALAGARDIWLSADGALGGVPWAAFIDEQGSPLVTSYRFTYLTSGRDLLRLGKTEDVEGQAVVMGAPDFDAIEMRGESARSTGAGGMRFQPLPATAHEAEQVARLWPGVRALVDAQATEGALKRAERPLLVHVATHGFILRPTLQENRHGSFRGVSLDPFAVAAELNRGYDPDPLLLSGVALVGANHSGDGSEDGLLFALEAADLNLRGTKLVVLSACWSGQGAMRAGEGMYGMRRALVLAGSQAQVLSFWRVADEATARFMVELHRKLSNGAARADAIREAQLMLLHDAATREPFYWAAFFLQGDPRSFSGAPPRPLR